MVKGQHIIAEHPRCLDKHEYCFEPRHYIPLLKHKPGALRDGAPFQQWHLPSALQTLKQCYLQCPQGDKGFMQLLLLLLLLIEEYGMDEVVTACELALEEKIIQLPAIVNLIHRFMEPEVQKQIERSAYPQYNFSPLPTL